MGNKHIFKWLRLIIAGIAWMVCGFQSIAQNPIEGDIFILDCPITTSKTYLATDYIQLIPDFMFSATPARTLILKIQDADVEPAIFLNNEYEFAQPIDDDLPIGAIPGQFQVAQNGSANYTIPIDLPPGTGGMVPGLAISYNSLAGDGLIGKGFNLSGLSSISRCGKDIPNDGVAGGVTFDNNDRFMLNGQRLILHDGNYGENNSTYRTEIETFSNIVAFSEGTSGPKFFKVFSPDGSILEFGRTDDSRIEPQGKPEVVMIWLINKITDINGNYIEFSYKEDFLEGTWRPSEIRYTGNDRAGVIPYNKVSFRYAERTDPTVLYINGSIVKQDVILKGIDVFCENALVRTYELDYSFDIFPHLIKVTLENQGEKVNSTVFGWDNGVVEPPKQVSFKNIFSDVSVEIASKAALAEGDFDGDGLTDILMYYNAEHPTDDNQLKYRLYKGKIDNQEINYVFEKESGFWFCVGLVPLDIDGDNITELLVMDYSSDMSIYKYVNNPNTGTPGFCKINGYVHGSGIDINRDGLEVGTDTTTMRLRREFLKNNLKFGDFDGNGLVEVLYRIQTHDSIYHWRIAGYKSTGGAPFWLGDWAYGGMYFSDNYKVNLADFNGDGKTEVLVGNKIYRFVEQWVDFEEIATTNLPDYDPDSVQFADFNGDGLMDMLYRAKNTLRWYTAIFDGKDHFNIRHLRNIPVESVQTGSTTGVVADDCEDDIPARAYFRKSESHFDCMDINNDGKAEILYRLYRSDSIWAFYTRCPQRIEVSMVPGSGNGTLESIYNYQSDGSFSEWGINQPLYWAAADNAMLNDFNGDGKTDYYDGKLLLLFKPFDQSQLVTGIKNNSGNYLNITYKPLGISPEYTRSANEGYWSLSGIYQTPNGDINMYQWHNGDWGIASYPYSVISPSFHAVTRVEKPTVITNVVDDENYAYHNALVHYLGKGFLGFESITVASDNLHRTVESTYDIRYSTTTYPLFSLKNVRTINTGPLAGDISTSDISLRIKAYPHGGTPLRLTYLPYSPTTISTNHLSGIEAETTSATPDSWGNIATITSNQKQNGTTQWTTTSTSTFENITTGNLWRIGLVKSNEITKEVLNTEEPEPAFSRYSEYEYTNGKLSREIIEPSNANNPNFQNDPGSVITIEKSFEYHPPSGSLIKTTESSGEISRFMTYNWDSRYRFVEKTTDQLGHSNQFTYDPIYGSILTQTDANGNVTRYGYDKQGKEKGKTAPNGSGFSFQYEWVSASHQSLGYEGVYSVATFQTGGEDLHTYFNILGKPTRTSGRDFNGYIVFTDYEYNSKGELISQSLPYRENDPGSKQEIIFTYDDYGRPLSKTGPAVNTTFQYTPNSTTVKVTDNVSGLWTEKATDAAGNATSSTDAGGTISYTYYSSRNPKTLSDPAGNTITMEYDLLGRKTKLIDPDAGTTTYTYNGLGDLLSQTDARGNTINLEYDPAGRLIKRTEPEDVYTYTYDTKPHGIGLISAINSGRGISHDYTYDNLSRISSMQSIAFSRTFTEDYAYDEIGRLDKYTYPYENHSEKFTVQYTYNESASNGAMKSVVCTTGQANNIWECTNANALGQILNATLGEGISTVNTYDPVHHKISRMETWSHIGIGLRLERDLSFTYNPKLLLESRSNYYHFAESFTYDNLNRLTSATVDGFDSQVVAFEDNTGNIEEKTGIGTYIYDATKPHAVNQIHPPENAPHDMPLLTQTITYTSFNKVAHIEEEGGFKMDIEYGVGNQRIKTELRHMEHDELIKRKYFIGNLEIEEFPDGSWRKLYHIAGGNGIAAVYEQKSDNNNKMHYIHTDQLGSWCLITDEYGNVEEEQNFDAWGRRRNPQTWAYYPPNSQISTIFDRGFTGHEHLDAFEIINMNGRMYDPYIGSFFSPDIFVQTPDATQGLNRYSY
ncbi:MAG: VCBS repeat-containing protein, partial [Bacteroidetes bacterium]|nr:VCBS repeat-containing protein [Bacteroidota bacterium]